MRYLFGMLFVVLFYPVVVAAKVVPLQEALVSAYQQNPQLQSARANLQASDEEFARAMSEWLPTVTLTAERGKEETVTGTAPDRKTITDSRELLIVQPVFKGGRGLNSFRRAKHVIKAERANLQRVEQNVLFDAISAYVEVLEKEEVYRISLNNERVLKKHLESTKERFALGEITRTDVAQARARFSRSISERALAEGDLVATKAKYKRVMGSGVPSKMEMPAVPADFPETLDGAIALAQRQNPTLESARFNEMAARDAVNLAKGALLPTVDLVGNIRRTEGFSRLGGGNFDTETASVRVRLPLYQAGSAYSRVRANRDLARKQRYDTVQTFNSVEEFIIQVWHNLDVARSNIRSTQDTVKAAEIALDGVKQEADVGSRTTLDVLDAEQELFVARVELIRAQRDEIVRAYQLKSGLGELTAHHLKLSVDYYNPEKHYNSTRYHIVGF